MRTLGTLASPGTWSTSGPLVGRTVANAQLLKSLVRYGTMDEVAVFIGEAMDVQSLEALTASWRVPTERVAVYTLWQLPELLKRGGIDVLHHASHAERLYDLVAVRDRYATRPTPVTGQTHSLSYPRLFEDLSRWVFIPPSATDALFCSSQAGRTTMERAFDAIETAARARGFSGRVPRWNLPVVPLGVEVAELEDGERQGTRKRLALPDDAVVLVGLARFTEYDKADLFPLLRVLERLVHAPSPGSPEVYLLLARARQGTRTPEMLQLWARHLGIDGRVRLAVDFAEAEKKDLLAAGDIFVSPVDNPQETFGQSVIEAQAAGLPCVVSDFDGYKDTVDEEVGIRVPTRINVPWGELSELAPLLYERPLHLALGQSVEIDLLAFEKALRTLVSDAPRRAAMGRAAAARARARYDWKRVVIQLETKWQELSQVRWDPPRRSHPLRLDYQALFGHFGTGPVEPTRRLQVHPERPTHVIYPELSSLVTQDDVAAVRSWAIAPKQWSEVVEFLTARLSDRPAWMAWFVTSWLVKQGLLVDVPADPTH
jgi:glycosyltransferase involved in cell wall biosynthesis